MRLIMVSAITLPLAACAGGAPSKGDVQQALQTLERLSQIEEVDQLNCVDALEGRYRCSFKVKVRSGNWVRDRETSRLFEKHPSGWVVVGE